MELTPVQQTTLILTGLLVVLILLVVIIPRSVRRARGAASIRRAAGEARGELPGPWRQLRAEVDLSNRCMTSSVFSQARQIFLDYYAGGRLSPADLTSEYASEEFLLIVNEHGQPGRPLRDLVNTFRQTSAAHAEFGRWFQAAVIEEGEYAGVETLLAARWLCHLAGLRHGTVEIFIDPPLSAGEGLEGHTLVQVRGMSKFEAPGAFDIPCAGHITGLDSPEASLAKELREELNLTLDDLDDFRLVGRYNSYTGGDEENGPALKINNEHRVLYRARLKAEAAARIRFSDGEVAGLSVISVSELRALVHKYPERIASGLSGAMGYYES